MAQEDAMLSIIVPIYNVEPFLRQCLDSIIGQTYRNLEIILIDDGSPDKCGAICDEYATKDNRIIVMHKKNGGVQAARNDGIATATGEWITFVDSDDWLELDYYERLFSALDNRHADVFCSGGAFFEEGDKTLIKEGFESSFLFCDRERIDQIIPRIITYVSEGKRRRNAYCYGSPWDKIYKTKFLRRHNLQFDPTCELGDDLWFNIQVFDKDPHVGGCTYIGYHYRQVAGSITKGFDKQKPQKAYSLIDRLCGYMNHHGKRLVLQEAIQARCIAVLRQTLGAFFFHPNNKMPYREIAIALKEVRAWPYFHDAIYSKSNKYLTNRLIIMKYLFRIPWIWPLKLAYSVRQRIKALF